MGNYGFYAKKLFQILPAAYTLKYAYKRLRVNMYNQSTNEKSMKEPKDKILKYHGANMESKQDTFCRNWQWTYKKHSKQNTYLVNVFHGTKSVPVQLVLLSFECSHVYPLTLIKPLVYMI